MRALFILIDPSAPNRFGISYDAALRPSPFRCWSPVQRFRVFPRAPSPHHWALAGHASRRGQFKRKESRSAASHIMAKSPGRSARRPRPTSRRQSPVSDSVRRFRVFVGFFSWRWRPRFPIGPLGGFHFPTIRRFRVICPVFSVPALGRPRHPLLHRVQFRKKA